MLEAVQGVEPTMLL